MFLRQIIEAFLVRTAPDSSMVKPAHIHITRAPQIKKAKVFRMNFSSSRGRPDDSTCSVSARATAGRATRSAAAASATPAVFRPRRRIGVMREPPCVEEWIQIGRDNSSSNQSQSARLCACSGA